MWVFRELGVIMAVSRPGREVNTIDLLDWIGIVRGSLETIGLSHNGPVGHMSTTTPSDTRACAVGTLISSLTLLELSIGLF